MVTLQVSIDAAKPLALLRNGGKRLQYAVVNAINDTAKAVQADVRAQASRSLTLRKRDFVLRQLAIISPFASVGTQRYEAKIAIGQKDRLLLTQLETGGTRASFTGAARVAVPITGGAARPAFPQPVPTAMRVTALRLIKVQAGEVLRTRKGHARRERATVTFVAHQTSTGKTQIKGARRTFVLTSTEKAPEGGIFQRIGPGKDDIRMIYSFARSPHLKASLHWLQTAERTATVRFPAELNKQIQQTVTYAFFVGK